MNIFIPPHVERDWIMPRAALTHAKPSASSEMLHEALCRPIHSPPLQELARGKRTAVILISDGSRLCPSYLFLERLLNELNAGGIADDAISVVVALGMHRKHTERELRELTGDTVFRRVRVLNHSALDEDCDLLGVTTRGTPVAINRHVVQADLRIATGNLEPHRLAGVSGGIKALVPGVAAHKTIEANHALSQRFSTSPGDPNNPLRLDMEEAQRMLPVHFVLNVVVNPERELLAAFAGDVIAAHRAATDAVKAMFLTPIARKYPLTIASAGGHPKDGQLYQAVKALQNAAQLTAPGGSILLVAECGEMIGNGLLQYWIDTIGNRAEIVKRLKETFVLGPHKVEHIDKVLQQHPVYMFSSLPDGPLELMGIRPVADPNEALHELFSCCPEGPVAVMPYASLTFPEVLSTSIPERSISLELEPLVP